MKAISLMYHDICEQEDTSGFPGADAALYKISSAEFSSHLAAISSKIKEKPARVTDWQNESNPIYITFDDGGKSALEAAEMLEKKGWFGHFFITTGKIGTETFVSRDEIIELHRRGHVVGSHSDSHPLRMASLSREEIFDEWRVSTEKLYEILGEKVTVASVPGGLYSKEVAVCAEACGIEFLFNSEPTTALQQIGNCRILGRYAVQNRMKAEEVSAIAAGSLSPRLKQTLIWNLKKPLKKVGGETFLKLRKFLISRKSGK
jgi:peptidoglycan/xylan/chitin deacetylase (PgdA/CDA1 family)